MKLKDLFETFYMTKMTPEQQKNFDDEMERYKEMSPSERRAEYRPFGKLGSRAKPEHIIAHRAYGTNKHDWGFSANLPGGHREQCHECGAARTISHKGNVIYR